MRDPHVEELRYELNTDQSLTFDAPPGLAASRHDLDFTLEHGILRIRPKGHFSTAVAARSMADPFVRCWEVWHSLDNGHESLHFDYIDAKVIDRNPPGLGEPQTAQVTAAEIVMTAETVAVHRTSNQYPEPPTAFELSEDVEIMYARLRNYAEGKETLPSMAYYCLTRIERRAGGRPQAAAAFGISIDVLRKLGELCSQFGDPLTARKATPVPARAHTEREVRWMRDAVRQLIRRVGEVDGGAKNLAQISMGDLQQL